MGGSNLRKQPLSRLGLFHHFKQKKEDHPLCMIFSD